MLSFLPPNAPKAAIPLNDGDIIGDLEGKYPIFIGVRFTKLNAVPDCSKSMNVAIMGRYEHALVLLDNPHCMPTRKHLPADVQRKMRNQPLSKMVSCDVMSLTRMGYETMSSRTRTEEIMPGFLKHITKIFETKAPTREEEMLVLGASKDRFFAENNYPLFDQRYIAPWDKNSVGVIQELVKVGEESIADEDKSIYAMVERNATTAEFAGYKVKIAHLPVEFADKAGELMARHQPFAVVYEDIPVQNKRIYRLYSHRGGLNVMDVAKSYKPEGTPRRASFSVTIDFSNYKFI